MSRLSSIQLLFLFIFFFSICSVQAKKDSINHDSSTIWDSNKKYFFDAFYLESNGDTITNEIIIVTPQKRVWVTRIGQNQILLKFEYFFSKSDSIKLALNPVNRTKWTDKHGTIKWRDTVLEGAIENEELIWMHPFRMNQYSLTEIAPFPSINLPLKLGKQWTETMIIAKGWGTYRGRHKQTKRVIAKKNYESHIGILTDCWQLIGTSEHKILGKSQINYLFHEKYGFVQMNYQFFNGQKIIFVLKNITSNP